MMTLITPINAWYELEKMILLFFVDNIDCSFQVDAQNAYQDDPDDKAAIKELHDACENMRRAAKVSLAGCVVIALLRNFVC
jgi:hypothetical protein